MTRVLAAVDAGPVSEAVIEIADCLARALTARSETVGVAVDATALATMTGRDVTQLEGLEGEVPAALVSAVADSDVVAVVVGIRSVEGGPRPTGHVTEQLITTLTVPVVAVPPDADPGCRALGSVLVPLAGDAPIQPVTQSILDALRAHGSVVDTLHVFDRSSVPMFWDGWHDHEIWARQFARRYSPVATAPEVRTGDVAKQILAAVADRETSLIVLEWKGRLDQAHAAVVHDLLCNSPVPLLLVPTNTRSGDEEER